MSPEDKQRLGEIYDGLTKTDVDKFKKWLASKGTTDMSDDEIRYMKACVDLKHQKKSNQIYKKRHG